jgi:hypothetical protein
MATIIILDTLLCSVRTYAGLTQYIQFEARRILSYSKLLEIRSVSPTILFVAIHSRQTLYDYGALML